MAITLEISLEGIKLSGEVNQSVTLPRGSITGGLMTDEDSVCKQLMPLIDGRHVKQCEIVFPASFAVVREISLPKAPKRKLPSLLRGQLEGGIPDIDRYAMDYIQLEQNDGGQTLLAILVQNRIVEQYLSLCAKLKLKCTAMIPRFERIRRAARGMGWGSSANIVIDLMPGSAEVSLLSGDTGSVFVRSAELLEQDNSLADWGIAFAANAQNESAKVDALFERVNSLIQFQAGRRRDVPVSAVYATGETERYASVLAACGDRLGRSIVPFNAANGE